MRRAALLVAALLAAPAAADDASMQALTTVADATVARRVLMDAVGFNNDALHDMLDGARPWDGIEFQQRLLTLNAMLLAFPHLFRAAPNPWTVEAEAVDPARASLALASTWADFATFEAMAREAATTAQSAAFAGREAALPMVERLEGQCEACHEAFRKSFADFHDFDMLPGPE